MRFDTSDAMKRIILISCANKKEPQRARAEELYDSPLFKKCLQYARRQKPDKVFILSAKHGLLELDEEIEPYDITLNNLTSGQVTAWADGVLQQLEKHADFQRDRFILLAGERYRKYPALYLASCEIPLLGMPIGKQLQFLTTHTSV